MLKPIWIILILLTIWMLCSMATANGKVKISGKVPMQKVALSIFAGVSSLIILVRYGPTVPNLLLILAIVAVAVIATALKHGVGDDAVYMNGRKLRFEKMNYYCVEDLQGPEGIKIRFNSDAKDFSLIFEKEDADQIKALMKENHIKPLEAYQDEMEAGAQRRKEAKAARENRKNKKK